MKVLTVSTKVENSFKKILFQNWSGKIFLLILFFLFLFALKFGTALLLWRNGFIEYDADGFTRSVRAWGWRNNFLKLEIDAWLPLQFWLNGWLLNFWPDLLRVPRFINLFCSAFTTVNLFLIGCTLFGRLSGYLTGFLAAIFPWEIWFGLSGMSESLTHFFLSFGMVFFSIWLKQTKPKNLVLLLASCGFLGATMVRYEAWFYSAIFALVVLYKTWRTTTSPKLKSLVTNSLLLAPAFIFIIIWMWASWRDPSLNSPFGFAKKTSEINAKIYGEANFKISFVERFFYYPKLFLNLFWPLTIPTILGSLWLAFRPVGHIRFYLTVVWGEFLLFILTTLPYNNIAPGSARYPVSNLLLLIPVISYLLQLLFLQPTLLSRLAGGILTGLLGISLLYSVFNQNPVFPDSNTRQVAQWLNDQWKDGSLKPDEKVVIQLPLADGPLANDFTRAYYALKVLTNHPDNFEVISDFAEFKSRVMITNFTAPSTWIQLKSAGGNSSEFKEHYREIKDFGDYVGGRFSAFRGAVVTPAKASTQQTFKFFADQFGPKETTISWLTGPDGKVINLGNKDADTAGKLSFDYQIAQAKPGTWAITIVGMQTGRRAIAQFEISS